jgi:outer membrane biosynthesis protein TonB
MRYGLSFVILAVALVLNANAAQAPGDIPSVQDPKTFPSFDEQPKVQYPAIAIVARVAGDVTVSFSTDGTAVTSVKVVSGPELLQKLIVQNVETWKFAPHKPGNFEAIVRFRILNPGDEAVVVPGPANLIQVFESPRPVGY